AYDIVIPAGQSRVIARPFVGTWPNYTRTHNRHDYACPPPAPTLLDQLSAQEIEVTGVGKIPNIFAQRGITHARPTHGNNHGIEVTLELIQAGQPGLIFTNLVDFDSLYGHRRNPEGYAQCLEAFDRRLPELIEALAPDDLLIISADHGNDPTWRGTDHTREYVPLLVVGPKLTPGVDLGVRRSFADVGQTLASYFDIPPLDAGQSFLAEINA
ncbi:MAG: phosphopentomutase, partial [Myxococcota bacterium]